MDGTGATTDARVAVTPGWGRLARHDRTLLFVPAPFPLERPVEVDDLFARFRRHGLAAAAHTDVPRCTVDWSDENGRVVLDTSVELRLQYNADDGSPRQLVTVEHWITNNLHRPDGRLVVVSNADFDPLTTPTDLCEGDVHADAFGLVFQAEPSSLSLVTPDSVRRPAEVTAEPPQFDELTGLDVTLTAVGPITYPDDDTDRTSRRPGDVRCPRGHANASTNHTCRVCGESLDSTANRPGPRASTAIAGLRLPDGSVIPINRSIAIGRAPSAAGARLEGDPSLVTIEAPSTVSRTHVLLRLDRGSITVTDCAARGRTAVVPAGDHAPIALVPWEPRALSIGDSIKLGGPTTLTITDPAELRVLRAHEATAPPPERDETT